MKIGIDARCLEWSIGGPARYLINMLKLWPQISKKHKYVLFFQNRIPEADFLNNELFEKVLIAGPKFLKTRRIVGEQLLMPFAIKKHKIELYFTPWYSIPLVPLGVKTVIGAWDIACNTHPHHYTILDRISFGIFVPRSYKKADGLLTCSNFDAQQIMNYCDLSSERFCVVPYAADNKFTPNVDPARIEEFRKKYKLPERYILSMGIIIPRRNVDVVIDAFIDIHEKNPDVGLVVVGRNVTVPYMDIHKKMSPLIGKGRGLYLVRAPEEEIVNFYQGAWYYICTSTVDGESLMLKEAMKCGTPVITSQFLMETVGGNALLLEDPTDRKQTAEALQKAISDNKLREHLSVGGKKWVDALSWELIAEKSLNFIESR